MSKQSPPNREAGPPPPDGEDREALTLNICVCLTLGRGNERETCVCWRGGAKKEHGNSGSKLPAGEVTLD